MAHQVGSQVLPEFRILLAPLLSHRLFGVHLPTMPVRKRKLARKILSLRKIQTFSVDPLTRLCPSKTERYTLPQSSDFSQRNLASRAAPATPVLRGVSEGFHRLLIKTSSRKRGSQFIANGVGLIWHRVLSDSLPIPFIFLSLQGVLGVNSDRPLFCDL